MNHSIIADSVSSSKRSWITIDLTQLGKNLRIYTDSVKHPCSIIAVVKANAYGHGDQVISNYLSAHGVKLFAVSNIDEAVHIREAGIKDHILILGYTPVDRVSDLIKYDLTQALISEEYAEMLSLLNPSIKAQFAIDTGMRRIGLNADNPIYCEKIIRKYSSRLQLNGLFTHLCVSDTPQEDHFTNCQIQLFENIVDRVSDLNLPYCHCMNSAGGLYHQSKYSYFIRLGIIMYGLKPDYTNLLPQGINPILTWKTIVTMVKQVQPGDTIGYGRSFIVKKTTTVATLSTGYADGYPRALSNVGWVLINGYKAHILGRVCMDQMMVDVTDIPNVHMGSEVVLVGQSGKEVITADDLAKLIGTIGYEIVCCITKRVKRNYICDTNCFSAHC